ncbi:DUF1553 domain-containing protein [Verrucomicrobium sp. BvORR106]|uniref:DUF1553 domain-containing protein n=1 Tax=Verrucomicrobium sp. BvORR106 TaxID=1403819 RepID=UPI0007C6F7A6|nr:DUF1553 domain-containing protein [Verrucomicrobium sp. BvORR106]
MLKLLPSTTPALARWVALAVSLTGGAVQGANDSPVSFNFQVQPILAGSCYQCHGPDEKQRKGGLRLDVREAALKDGVIVPGKPEASSLIERLFTSDEDEVMPPPDSHKTIDTPQREVLKKWIAEGASYERHWSFTPPRSPAVPLPTTADAKALASFPITNPVDAFVLDHLRVKGHQPALPASRERWLRRVTFDLTGLPPTLQEMDAFLADTSPQAYETVVDRLLASQRYGERMATDWLDAARYADSYGRHEDAESIVWPYRDWVIQAFNDNLPYDEFIVRQTAGDELSDRPRTAEVLATTFNRLVPQSNEAGSNEEEFRQEHVADRIKTNATAILGLTLECARCHDHKYDPLTQREYYQMAAFFNNIAELGLFPRQTAGIPAPGHLLMSSADEERNLAMLQEIKQAEAAWDTLQRNSRERYEAWVDEHGKPPPATPTSHYEFESVGEKKRGQRKLFSDSLHPDKFTGVARQSIEPSEGVRGLGLRFEDDNGARFPGVGVFRRSDPFSIALWIRPEESQSRAVVIHRTRSGLDAASRGYELLLNELHPEFSLSHYAPGNSIRIHSKTAIPLNAWTHIIASYDGSSRSTGLRLYVNGKAAEAEVISDHLYRDILYRPEWGDYDAVRLQDNIDEDDVALSIGYRPNDKIIKNATFDDFKIFDKTLSPNEAALLALPPQPPKKQEERGFLAGIWYGLTHPFVGRAPDVAPTPDAGYEAWLRDLDPQGKAALKRLHDLRTAQDDLVNHAREIMVMREMEPRRATFVLARGQFDQPGEQVFPETPASILPLPADFPRNRLGLARWYVDRRNPLTARVAVNRIWQVFFGRGIVGTSEDFGIQGELPTHPELLDWLAVDFMDQGWDVKRLCRIVVLSSTYRQSSTPQDPQLLKDDPDNRLLARGPRHRLSAEMIRDNALAISGLLTPTMGGPPTRPYLPENLYEDSGVQMTYKQSHGEALWRRSLYTFWKRTLPPPTMTIFDAPSREFCLTRRETTSTPMQSLAMMNAPEFVEAARALAERLIRTYPQDRTARIAEAFRLTSSRSPRAGETSVLLKLLEEEHLHYTQAPQEAEALRRGNGEHPADLDLPGAEVAATTMLIRVLLGSEEALLKE